MSWINGQLSRSLSLAWYLAPQRLGEAKVHTIRLAVGDQEVALPDQQAWVEDRPGGGTVAKVIVPAGDGPAA